MERLLEELSYDAVEQRGSTVVIDAKRVEESLGALAQDEDVSRFIL
jgi:ATP-dependent HslUV protease ATP-binding subunit HslU